MPDVAKLRKEQGLRQSDLAAAAEVTTQYIWMLENGERKPSVKVAQRIAAVLGFDWTEFFKETA